MSSLSLAECQLVAVFMTSVAYGIYLVTLGMCLQTLFWPQSAERRVKMNRPLAVAMVLMAIFATLEAAFTLRFAMDGFIYKNGPGGPEAVFRNVSAWVNVMKTTDVQVMTFIGDGILIYRCFVIYARSRLVIIFPIILWIGNGVCGGLQIWSTVVAPENTGQAVLGAYVTAFFVITVSTNILVTGLIVLRIWRVDKASPRSFVTYGRPTLQHVAIVLVESGLLYTTTVIVALAVHLSGNNAITPMADIMVEIIGISFNLIIIRVNRGIAVGDVDDAPRLQSFGIPLRSMRRPAFDGGVEIAISTHVDRSPATDDNISVMSKHDGSTKGAATIA